MTTCGATREHCREVEKPQTEPPKRCLVAYGQLEWMMQILVYFHDAPLTVAMLLDLMLLLDLLISRAALHLHSCNAAKASTTACSCTFSAQAEPMMSTTLEEGA
eukprot:2349647-Amphidinium_carterae.1